MSTKNIDLLKCYNICYICYMSYVIFYILYVILCYLYYSKPNSLHETVINWVQLKIKKYFEYNNKNCHRFQQCKVILTSLKLLSLISPSTYHEYQRIEHFRKRPHIDNKWATISYWWLTCSNVCRMDSM